MFNQIIRKEILIVEDIVKPVNETTVIFSHMGLKEYKEKQRLLAIVVFLLWIKIGN